jgi:hypothetical protein
LEGPETRFSARLVPGTALMQKDPEMRLILRVLGTVLIALAVILLIIDGTKSLAASAFVATPLGETWMSIHAQSLEQMRTFLTSRFFGPLLEAAVSGILTLPGWAVLGVPGVLLAWAGRSRNERIFLRQDNI